MKNFHIFFILFIFSFVSCTKDDTNETLDVTAANIKGTWNLTSISCKDGMNFVEILGQVNQVATFEISGKDYDATVVISENPNTFISSGTYTAVGKSTSNGMTQTLELPFEEFTQTGTWKLDNNKIIFIAPGGEESIYDVIKLTESTMEYKLSVNLVEEDEFIKTITKGTYFVTLSR
jgi:hypothetical protein